MIIIIDVIEWHAIWNVDIKLLDILKHFVYILLSNCSDEHIIKHW